MYVWVCFLSCVLFKLRKQLFHPFFRSFSHASFRYLSQRIGFFYFSFYLLLLLLFDFKLNAMVRFFFFRSFFGNDDGDCNRNRYKCGALRFVLYSVRCGALLLCFHYDFVCYSYL